MLFGQCLNFNTEVLILAAGTIKHKFSFIKFGFKSPALLPINTRTTVSFVLDFYLERDIPVNLVINKEDYEEVKNELIYYQNKINFILIEKSNSVIETLDIALNKVNSNDIIVNVVTTIPIKLISKNSYFLSDEVMQAKEYSLVYKNNFYYKGNKIHKGNAFTGVFRTNKEKIKNAINQTGYKNDLMYIIENLKYELRPEYITWIDVGHEINYHKAKNLLISSRSFNTIKVMENKGILIKTSKNKDKFNDEIEYISMLPSDVKVYFPRIIEKNLNEVKMEYYGYPTLAEYMLYWKIDNIYWNKIFGAIENVLDEFTKYEYSIGFNAYFDFYYNKLTERLKSFKKQIDDKFLFDNYLIINNKKYKNINLLDKQIKQKIIDLYSEDDFTIMHGDLCFNNILYDLYSNIIRMIDTRGSFGKCKGIYGDRKYDIAKLTHSVIGQYDYIVNNIFKIQISNGQIFYEIPKRENYEYLKTLNVKLIEKNNYSYEDIIFLVGLLFVSMTPLHNDNIDRQITMYAHGIKFINEGLE